MLFRFRRCGAIAAAAIALISCRTSPQEKAARLAKRAEEFAAKKDFHRAALDLQNAVAAQPNNADLHYRLGAAYLEVANYPSAVLEFQKAVKLDPKHQKAQTSLAVLMNATRDPQMARDAKEKLEGVLKQAPDDVEAMDGLARSDLLLGRLEDAARLLDEALKKAPADLGAAISLAQIKLAEKDKAGAEEVMERAAKAAPRSSEAALALGQVYVLDGRFDRAEPEVRRALQLDPRNPRALMSMAALQIAGRRTNEAERTYAALAALPEARFKSAHAIFLYQTGQRDRSVQEFEKLVHDNPKDRDLRNQMVKAYVAMGRVPQARAVLTAALKQNPKDADAQLQLSQLDIGAGDTAAAETKLTQFLHLSPDSAPAHLALSRVYAAQGMNYSERQELQKAMQLDNRLIAARVGLARNLRESHQLALALQTIDGAPGSYKRVVAVVIERNWILLAMKRIDDVKQGIANGLRAGRLPEFVLQDGLVKFMEKDYPAARAEAEELLARNPEDVMAARLLVQTYIAQKEGQKGVERLRVLAADRPKSAGLQQLLGEFYLAGGNRLAARQAFDAATRATPAYLPAVLAKVELDLESGQLNSARAQLEEVLRTHKNSVPALLQSARVEKQLGNTAAAVARYRSVLSIDNSNLEALNNLAYTIVLQDSNEALKLAQNAAALAPNDANVMDTLGLVYFRKGLYSEAIPYLKQAFDREPTPRHRFHLALGYLKGGDRDLGRKNLQLALEQDPTLKTSEAAWY